MVRSLGLFEHTHTCMHFELAGFSFCSAELNGVMRFASIVSGDRWRWNYLPHCDWWHSCIHIITLFSLFLSRFALDRFECGNHVFFFSNLHVCFVLRLRVSLFFCFSSGRLSKNLHKILIWMIRNESRQSASAFFLGRSSKETSTFSPFYYVKCEREAQIEYCHLLKRNLWSLSFVSGFRLGAMRLAETPTTIQSLFGKLPVLITCCWPTIIVCEKSILLIKWTCKGFLFVKWEI